MDTIKVKTEQSALKQAAEITRLVRVAFPALANANFTSAWKDKSIQRHLLALAPTTTKKAVQATKDYLAIKEELTSHPDQCQSS